MEDLVDTSGLYIDLPCQLPLVLNTYHRYNQTEPIYYHTLYTYPEHTAVHIS
jgi:hypothetical protein